MSLFVFKFVNRHSKLESILITERPLQTVQRLSVLPLFFPNSIIGEDRCILAAVFSNVQQMGRQILGLTFILGAV